METQTGNGFDIGQRFTDVITTLSAQWSSPWTLYQFGLILACFAASFGLARVLTPPLEARLRRLEGQPQLLRLLVIPLRRLQWLVLAVLLWLVAMVLREVTWPSRSYLVMLAATLVGAWAVISILSRMFRNRTMARIVAVAAWVLVALALTGTLDLAARILDGAALSLGDQRVSLLMVVKAVAVFAVLLWLASVVGEFTERRLAASDDLTPTYQVLFAKLIRAGLLALAIVLTLNAVGVDLTALAVFSGALGLGIGFGLQKVASNLISGLIILIDKSIKPGDVISIEDRFGWITSLQSRYVSVVTRDGVEYLIPNETFVSETVVNWSHSNRQVRLEIKFGVSYDDDPHLVRRITVEAVGKLGRVISAPAPVCHVVGFGDSSVDFVLRYWISDPENGVTNISGQAYLAIWDAFKEHDISIPYPHREVRLTGKLTTQAGMGS